MSPIVRGLVRRAIALCTALAATVALAGTALALSVTRLSTDPYSNTSSYHRTEVEPDSFSFGSTIVAAFQVGRFPDGGASNIGWATTSDGGVTWAHGFMPGITRFESSSNPFDRATDPSVAYDAKHDVWMVSSLGLVGTNVHGAAVVVSRSADGGFTWADPVTVASAGFGQDFDKNWTACDDRAASPWFGTCYTEYDDFASGNQLHVARSTDGGLHWSEASVPKASVIGGQPLSQPDGTVVMPIDSGAESVVESFVSTDGGVTFSGPYRVAKISQHGVAGSLRTDALPSADVDADGRVFVSWQDCRFRHACASNDIVVSTSNDGRTWAPVARIPIDPRKSSIDHFAPGLALDHTTGGANAHVGLTYYFYPSASCSASTCQLEVGFVASNDGGATWSRPVQVDGPMAVTGLPRTSQGYMFGDYISTSFAGGAAFPALIHDDGATCTLGDVTSCDVFAASTASGLTRRPGRRPLDTAPAVTSAGPRAERLTARRTAR